MHINNISQKAASFILHKRFHPGNFKNMEKVWLAEQRATEAVRKESELQQKRAQELKIKELRKQHESPADAVHSSIQWVYAQEDLPKPAPPPEAAPNEAPAAAPGARVSKYVLEEPDKFGEVSEADVLRKLREDPLVMIKKAEILRTRKEQVKNIKKNKLLAAQEEAARVRAPRWVRQDCHQDEFLIEERPSSDAAPHRRGNCSSDDEDLGPSATMKSIVRARQIEAARAGASESAVADEGAEGGSIEEMLQRGRDVEDDRRLRLERLRLLESERSAAERAAFSAAPSFLVKTVASAGDTFSREQALRSRRHDATLMDEHKYYDDEKPAGAIR